VLREPAAMLRTAGAADNASKALQEAAAAKTERLEARCFLLPRIRPGQVVEVQSLPDGLSGGPWLITRVTHRLGPARGGETILEAESADAGSLVGQLAGAALAALGGLL
jgi:phage protein D